MKGKRLLLWKEILVDLKYPDAAVIDEALDFHYQVGLNLRESFLQM